MSENQNIESERSIYLARRVEELETEYAKSILDNEERYRLLITENEQNREKAEKAAKTAEEKYHVLTSLLPDMIIETDVSGRVSFVNLKVIDIFGYGSDFFSNDFDFTELIGKEDKLRCSEDLEKVITGEVNVSKAIYTAVTKNGRKFPAMVHARKMYSNDELTGLNILMFNSESLEFAEQKAHNLQKNMKFLSESALKFLTFSNDDDIFIFIGKNLSKFASKSIIVVFSYNHNKNTFNIRYISRIYSHINELVEILGKSPEEFEIELPDKYRREYLSDKTLKRLDDGLADIIAENRPKEKAQKIQKLLKVDNFYSMGMERNGKLYGGLLIATNKRTESIDTQTIETFIYQAGIALHRKQIDNELVKAKLVAEESDRLKSAFLANMSHELRTPLNGILGLSQMMLKSDTVELDNQKDLKMIFDSASSLLTLIEDIMDVTRIEANQLKTKPRPFVLNTLMDQLYSIFSVNPIYLQKNSVQKNVVLRYEKPHENITILSDPDRLKQIFVNLLTNALKFTQKGFIQYGYSIKDTEIIFYVKDTGIGIPKDKTDKIFDRFTQVDSTLARKFTGSGLGLAISKGLISLLDGRIWCISDLGKGSIFYFTIPFCPTTQQTTTDTVIEKNSLKHDWSDYTVLIVEDDFVNFKVIERMLKSSRLNIIHADTGMKAIEQVRLNQHIDLVLMDVHLPEMNGLEATNRILAINSALPVIAQTANAMSDDKDRCIEAGCVDYISKPIDMTELYGKMSRFLPDK